VNSCNEHVQKCSAGMKIIYEKKSFYTLLLNFRNLIHTVYVFWHKGARVSYNWVSAHIAGSSYALLSPNKYDVLMPCATKTHALYTRRDAGSVAQKRREMRDFFHIFPFLYLFNVACRREAAIKKRRTAGGQIARPHIAVHNARPPAHSIVHETRRRNRTHSDSVTPLQRSNSSSSSSSSWGKGKMPTEKKGR